MLKRSICHPISPPEVYRSKFIVNVPNQHSSSLSQLPPRTDMLHQLRQVPHLQLHLTLQLFAVVNEGHKRLLVAFSWRWSLSLPRRTIGSSPEDQKKDCGQYVRILTIDFKEETWEFKTWILLCSFFAWTPQMRNKNRTLNKLVMRPWKLGNLDVIFFYWAPPKEGIPDVPQEPGDIRPMLTVIKTGKQKQN